jgi:mycothiol synthase
VLTLATVPTSLELTSDLSALAEQLERALDAHDEAEGERVLARAEAMARREAVERLVMTAEPAESAHQHLARRTGMELDREILQLRRPLPLTRQATVSVRPFRPGLDDEAWLDLNNRAFAWHPDQSGWTVADLAARIAEPWFDADGFLLHEVDGHLAGFCWTKVHTDTSPPLGEIYVIAIDPAVHGRGLGEQLTLAGLDWLAAHGLKTAMLYVEADNRPARSLYERLGFTVHHAKRWWERVLEP